MPWDALPFKGSKGLGISPKSTGSEVAERPIGIHCNQEEDYEERRSARACLAGIAQIPQGLSLADNQIQTVLLRRLVRNSNGPCDGPASAGRRNSKCAAREVAEQVSALGVGDASPRQARQNHLGACQAHFSKHFRIIDKDLPAYATDRNSV